VPSAAPHASGPVTSSEVSVSGLRVRSGTLARSSLWGFTEVAVDLRLAELQIVRPPRGAPLNQLLPTGALLVINGGYFEADFRPSTWVRSQGLDLAPRADTSRGGLLAVKGELAFVGPFSGLGFDPELAIQSFPLIVEHDAISGIRSDDGKRAARTVACMVGGELRFVVIAAARGDGPTLFESATLLREPPPLGFGCSTALNLDGGPSAGVWFAPSVPARQRLPLALVGYAIAVLPVPAR